MKAMATTIMCMKRMRNKLKGCRGATLLEMLCALLVLVLLMSLVVTGVQLGAKAWRGLQATSQGQQLCRALSATIRQELRFADRVLAGEMVTFDSRDHGARCRFVSREGRLYLETEAGSHPVLPETLYPAGSRAELRLEFDENEKIFTVWLTVLEETGKCLAEAHFQVECLGESICATSHWGSC